ncbi:MAG TPA: histidine phosphatase family protein [Nevskiaceae bacterium]|nr:histidine phosphatase family protein [Nevskiaceae bacterium]
MTSILLIRHGQASFGAADYDDLSPLGERQARMLGAALHEQRVSATRVLCGAMRRHRQTAQACLAALGCGLTPDIDAGWNEYDHNDVLHVADPQRRARHEMTAEFAFATDPHRAFRQAFTAAMGRWIGGAHDDEYRESWPAFKARVAQALEACRSTLQPHGTALVFSSGGAIAAACGSVLGLSDAQILALNTALVNASVTKLLVARDGLRLSSFNGHTHFERQPRDAAGTRLVTYW